MERLDAGEDVAVVTDGGMPSISDPGYRVVRLAVERGIDVRVVPGPSAAIAALVLSGLPTDRFVFEGFLPRRPERSRRRLQALRHDPRTIVFFESPRRVHTLLREIADHPRGPARRGLSGADEAPRGGRPRAASRRCSPSSMNGSSKGEVAVVVEGEHDPEAPDVEALLAEVRVLVEGGMRTRDAARAVAERHGASANELYRAAISEG